MHGCLRYSLWSQSLPSNYLSFSLRFHHSLSTWYSFFPFHHCSTSFVSPPSFHQSPFPPFPPYISPRPPSSLPPISFTSTGLQLIRAAGCVCFHCCVPSQQMCISRPSGAVIGNKDPMCVCRKEELAAMSICEAASSPLTHTHTHRGDSPAPPCPGGSPCTWVDNEAGRPSSLGLSLKKIQTKKKHLAAPIMFFSPVSAKG